MNDFREVRRIKQRRFLKHFSKLGNITKSAELAGISSTMHYNWMRDDEVYAQAFTMARDMAADILEGVAWDRANKSSDLLLIFLLKGLRPDVYREQRVIVGDEKKPITHEMRISVVRTDNRENYQLTQTALGPGTDSGGSQEV